MALTYLDHAATSPLLLEVIDAMHVAEEEFFANASALHTPGHSAMNAIEKAKVYLATLAMDKRLHTWFDLSGQLFACTGTDSEAHAPSAYMYGFGANELADSLERKLSGAAGAAYVRGRAPV